MNTNLLSIFAVLAVASVASAAPQSSMPDAKSKPGMSASMGQMLGTTSKFQGPEIHAGTVSISKEMGKTVLRLSSDFVIPQSPAPHYQVVDAEGNVFLLGRLTLVGDKTRREIALPNYIKSVKKVQIYCSFVEVVLGEGSFREAVRVR